MPFILPAQFPFLTDRSPLFTTRLRRRGGNSIPCAPYATFGTRELSEHVAGSKNRTKAPLLQHHGLSLVRVNLEKAL